MIVDQEKLTDEQAAKVLEIVDKTSRKTAYRLTVDAGRRPGLTDSKFGGVPYWNPELDYPVSSTGDKLVLLAQINLSDVKKCELLPKKGILQFFADCDDLYGMDYDNSTSNDTFRVVYHESINKSVTAEDVLAIGIPVCTNPPEGEDEFLFPLDCEVAIKVEKTEVSVGTEDFMFDKYVFDAALSIGIRLPENAHAYSVLPEDAFDRVWNKNANHWLLGYAFFTQADPREYSPQLQDYILLFQMDSEYSAENNYEILWGDCGVGNFFIKPDDLAKRDFSKVMYNWDCG